jgi:tetratricopeptide (TPR) repeat protein
LALKEARRYAEAQAILEELTLVRPDSAALYVVLGDVYRDQGMLVRAVDSFRTSTTLAPGAEVASLGLFHSLWDLGDRSAALAEARRYVAIAESDNYQKILSDFDKSQRGEVNTNGDER